MTRTEINRNLERFSMLKDIANIKRDNIILSNTIASIKNVLIEKYPIADDVTTELNKLEESSKDIISNIDFMISMYDISIEKYKSLTPDSND